MSQRLASSSSAKPWKRPGNTVHFDLLICGKCARRENRSACAGSGLERRARRCRRPMRWRRARRPCRPGSARSRCPRRSGTRGRAPPVPRARAKGTAARRALPIRRGRRPARPCGRTPSPTRSRQRARRARRPHPDRCSSPRYRCRWRSARCRAPIAGRRASPTWRSCRDAASPRRHAGPRTRRGTSARESRCRGPSGAWASAASPCARRCPRGPRGRGLHDRSCARCARPRA